MKLPIIVIAAALVCASCSILCNRKPNLKDTRWTGGFEEFIADVGTGTASYTLEFGSAGKYTLESKHVIPSHPATYVNPDGTIDRIPGHTSGHTSEGTWRVSGNTVTLTDKEGATYTLHYLSGLLESDDLSYQHLVFKQEEKK